MAKNRKIFLVEKQVQGALGRRIVSHWLIFLGLSVSVTCALQMLGNFGQQDLWARFESAMLGQVGSIVVLLALLPWFIHDSLKLSNRFAGPMVRLKKSIVELTNQADTPPVVFRSGDFWQEIAQQFNELRMRVVAEREQLAQHQHHNADGQRSPADTPEGSQEHCIAPLSSGHQVLNSPLGCNS